MKRHTFALLAMLKGTQCVPGQQLRTVEVRTPQGVLEGCRVWRRWELNWKLPFRARS